MSTETNYNFYLVADAKDTGIKTHKEAHEVLVQLAAVDEETKEKQKVNFFCFWGCYGDAHSKLPSKSQDSYIKGIDGNYYLKETNFTIVKGYEAVPFSLAVDKSVYRVGPYQPGRSDVKVPTGDDDGSTSATATRNEDDADDDIVTDDTRGKVEEIPDATKLVLTYKKDDDTVYSETWYRKNGGGDDPDNPSAPGEGDTAIVASEANQIYIIYCGLTKGSGSGSGSTSSRGADNEYYAFAFQELKEGVYVWSLKYRLNVFKADYSSTKPNDYTLKQVDKELNGTYPGLK